MTLLSPPTALLFFFNDTATTEIYTLSLHDALPIFLHQQRGIVRTRHQGGDEGQPRGRGKHHLPARVHGHAAPVEDAEIARSEEHTSELQSHLNLVCRLLLEKKNKKKEKYDAIVISE